MTKKYFVLLSTISATVIFLTVFLRYSYSENRVNMRICVASGKEKISMIVKSPYKIMAINSDITLEKGRHLKADVFPTATGLMVGDKEFKVYGIRIVPRNDASIFINRTCLRGAIDIIRTEERELLVVNHVDIEKYLYGVLHHEVPFHWPAETLKAQAVAARTFALYRKNLMHEEDYDVTNDIYSQVYGGRSGERWRTRRAVDLTRGKVLTYGGELLSAYYHSICAGHTENAEIVFEVDLPPLKGRRCPYCKGAPGTRWKALFSYKQIEERLNKYGIKVKAIRRIKEGTRDASGRLEHVKLEDSTGQKEVKGFKFRLALGPNVIRSTNFSVKVTPKGVLFRGKGWGHGVGMCQWGAFGMARRRFNYKKILEFYYPGTKLEDYAKVVRL